MGCWGCWGCCAFCVGFLNGLLELETWVCGIPGAGNVDIDTHEFKNISVFFYNAFLS